MISGVTKEIAGRSETFRMTTRAMMAIEDHYGDGIAGVLQGLEDGFRVGDLARILAECAGDGAGVDIDVAAGLVDGLGMERAGVLLGEIAEAAFPEAKGKAAPTGGKAPAKNRKRAARSK